VGQLWTALRQLALRLKKKSLHAVAQDNGNFLEYRLEFAPAGLFKRQYGAVCNAA
jgi:hypothetical protein